MSKVNFNDYETAYQKAQNFPTNSAEYAAQNPRPQVGFFKLENDGDEAIVRILCDSTEDFELLNVHNVTLPNSKFPRKVNCLREAHEDISKCPFCQNGDATKLTKRLFVRLLQYSKNPDGTIKVEAKIWERPAKFGFELRDDINNYGPLSDMICKIVRHGVPKSTDTTYQILPNLSKTIYRDDIYLKKTELFDGYHVVGHVVMNKAYDDTVYYLQNGEFPAKVAHTDANAQATPKNTYSAPENTSSTTPAPQERAPWQPSNDDTLPF